jgi:hypothetical protein
VYLVIVFLSVILPMLWLSSKLKRNIIITQNLTMQREKLLCDVKGGALTS